MKYYWVILLFFFILSKMQAQPASPTVTWKHAEEELRADAKRGEERNKRAEKAERKAGKRMEKNVKKIKRRENFKFLKPGRQATPYSEPVQKTKNGKVIRRSRE